jgi:predicted regulator of Ras-like GTPase activity (Roadblock/LC7/MglB family)
MAFDTLLNELKDIDGYLASAIMNFSGGVLVADSKSEKIDLKTIAEGFNNIFRAGHEVAGKVGFNSLEGAVLMTPNGVIIMACSGVNAAAHLHFIVILKRDGNQALAKITLEKIVHQAIELSR